MNRAVSQEFCVCESRNHAQDPLLLRNAKTRLKTDDVPHVAVAILASQLNNGPRPTACSRIGETDRLQRPKTQSVAPALRRNFDGHAPFEVRYFVELVSVKLIC